MNRGEVMNHGGSIDGAVERSIVEKSRDPSFPQGVPDPSSDVRDPRPAPARDLFLVRDSIRQLESDDQGIPDQATKDVCDPIHSSSRPVHVHFAAQLLWWSDSTII
ncbi:hypothetical protein F2Q68_00006597 [Brassica cretica]|uniref:Uncharacterized protein n=1 Tax=Brassica cretica TaxID=69181 RepID=A0A8S9JBE5_BRACR|nr:hypothetical protein F2Q68_00006597 [Brassica cretica]